MGILPTLTHNGSSPLAPAYLHESAESSVRPVESGWQSRNSSNLSSSLLDAATVGPRVDHSSAHMASKYDNKADIMPKLLRIYSDKLNMDAENGTLLESACGRGDFYFNIENHTFRQELHHSFVRSLIEGASAGEEIAPEVSFSELRYSSTSPVVDFEDIGTFLFVRRREMRPENENYYSIRTRTSSMVTFVLVGSASNISTLMNKKVDLFNDMVMFDSACQGLASNLSDTLLVNISLRDATASAKLKPHVNADNEIDYTVKAYKLPFTNQYAATFEFPMTAADTTMRNLNGQRELFVDAHLVLSRPQNGPGRMSRPSTSTSTSQCHPATSSHSQLQYSCADCYIKVDIQPGMVKRGGRDVKTLPSAMYARGPSVSPTPMSAPLVELECKESLPKKKERASRKRVTNNMAQISSPPERRRVQHSSSRPLFIEDQASLPKVEESYMESAQHHISYVTPVANYYTGMYAQMPREMVVPVSMHPTPIYVFASNEWDSQSNFNYSAAASRYHHATSAATIQSPPQHLHQQHHPHQHY